MVLGLSFDHRLGPLLPGLADIAESDHADPVGVDQLVSSRSDIAGSWQRGVLLVLQNHNILDASVSTVLCP